MYDLTGLSEHAAAGNLGNQWSDFQGFWVSLKAEKLRKEVKLRVTGDGIGLYPCSLQVYGL